MNTGAVHRTATASSPARAAPVGSEVVVAVHDVWKSFGSLTALAGVSLTVRQSETLVVMGPSGCGKSVLLKHLVGLHRPDRGDVRVFGLSLPTLSDRDLDALRIRIGVVFQSGALFDSLSVGDNVAFPLRRHSPLDRAAIARRVGELLALVELEGTEPVMPAALSGGMRKRVGIARALALQPSLVLYDEPTSGLDPLTARTVDDLILRLRADLGVTSVVVTHDLESAFRLGDRIAVMDAGRLEATGRPDELLASPDALVRRFLATRTVPVIPS